MLLVGGRLLEQELFYGTRVPVTETISAPAPVAVKVVEPLSPAIVSRFVPQVEVLPPRTLSETVQPKPITSVPSADAAVAPEPLIRSTCTTCGGNTVTAPTITAPAASVEATTAPAPTTAPITETPAGATPTATKSGRAVWIGLATLGVIIALLATAAAIRPGRAA